MKFNKERECVAESKHCYGSSAAADDSNAAADEKSKESEKLGHTGAYHLENVVETFIYSHVHAGNVLLVLICMNDQYMYNRGITPLKRPQGRE